MKADAIMFIQVIRKKAIDTFFSNRIGSFILQYVPF